MNGAKFGITRRTGRIFNIVGPYNPAKHYMLPAMARLSDVTCLIEDEAYLHLFRC